MIKKILLGSTMLSLLSADPALITGMADSDFLKNVTPTALASSVILTDGVNYSDGYLDVALSDTVFTDTLTLNSSAIPIDDGAISVIGSDVFVGDGTTTTRVGSVDSVRNGLNGQPLRIIFASPLTNGGFEDDLNGWTVTDSEYVDIADGTSIGYSSDDFGTGEASILHGTNDGTTFDAENDSNLKTEGASSLQLYSHGNITCTVASGGSTDPDKYCSIHGPSVLSTSFEALDGDSLTLDWTASEGGDWYEVFGFIINQDTGEQTPLFSQRGDSQPWTSISAVIPDAGTYKFLFVSGTYDASGGLLVGATLNVDNIRLVGSSAIDDALVTNILNAIDYSSTSTNEPFTTRDRTVTVETKTTTGDITTDTSATLHIIQEQGLVWHREEDGKVNFQNIDYKTLNAGNMQLIAPTTNANLMPEGSGDFTGDGIDDILVRNEDTGKLAVWDISVDGNISTDIIATTSNTAAHMGGVADFDDDGDLDISMRNDYGVYKIWTLDGLTRDTAVSVTTDLGPDLKAVSAGDMDGDGIPDTIFQNKQAGFVKVFTMNDDMSRKDSVKILSGLSPDLEVRMIGDVNGDGTNDIIAYNTKTGLVKAYLLDGSAEMNLIDVKPLTTNENLNISPHAWINRITNPVMPAQPQ